MFQSFTCICMLTVQLVKYTFHINFQTTSLSHPRTKNCIIYLCHLYDSQCILPCNIHQCDYQMSSLLVLANCWLVLTNISVTVVKVLCWQNRTKYFVISKSKWLVTVELAF